MTETDRTILVVDDDPQTGRWLASILQFGYGVEVVTLVDEAVLRLESQPEKYGLLFTDLIMRSGPDGESLAAAVKRNPRLAHVFVVAVSGAAGLAEIVARAGVFDDYLHKPWEIDGLLHVTWKHQPMPHENGVLLCRKCKHRIGPVDVRDGPASTEWSEVRRHWFKCQKGDRNTQR